jgi:hypothetical protein
MDCHVHYGSPGGPEWIARFTDPLPEISMRAIELAEASLRRGVTTARDVGAPEGVSIRLARVARAGEIRAPNIRAAGTWIAHRGTYVSFARQFGEAGELRDAISVEIEAGADLIKVALAGWNEGARPKDAPDDRVGKDRRCGIARRKPPGEYQRSEVDRGRVSRRTSRSLDLNSSKQK